MIEQEVYLKDYVTPKSIIDRLYSSILGGKSLGNTGYQYVEGKLPLKGGNVTLTFNKLEYHGNIINQDVKSTTPIFTLTCNFPKEAVEWYQRLNPELNVWDAPINNFNIKIFGNTENLEEKARKLFAVKRSSDIHI